MKNAPALLLLCLAAACGPGTPDDEAPPPAVATSADSADEVPSDTSAVTVAALPVGPPRSAVFPHAPHRDVTCRTCHGALRGHATHAEVPCKECHAATGGPAARDLTRAECLGCHHAPTQTVACATCHGAVPPRSVSRTLRLSVWTAERSVTLPFDHARHDAVACAACHSTPPFLTPDRPCGTCHERHHRADAVCASCHAQPPPGAHDLRVHGGCSGAGCHDAAAVADLPRSRQACEVCHRDRAEHYPDRDCAPCHRLGSAPEEP